MDSSVIPPINPHAKKVCRVAFDSDCQLCFALELINHFVNLFLLVHTSDQTIVRVQT